MARPWTSEQVLRFGVFAGIALLLLTPFVVTSHTIFPYIVGKAVWSRSIIEVTFALWAALALAKPEYRPRRSWLLVVLAAGLAVSLLTACFGVSIQRSLWSTYERMQGLVDLAHWLALAVVLVSVLRTGTAWRTLLGASAGAGTTMACLIIARHYELDVPFYGNMLEPRMSGPFGNPLFLSFYMLANLMVSLGLAVRFWLNSAGPATPLAQPRGRRRAKMPEKHRQGQATRWLIGLLGVAAALHLWVLTLAGSVGRFAGLFASIGFVAVSYAFLGRGRSRWIAAAMVVFLGVSAIGMGMRFAATDRPATLLPDHPVARYVASVHIQRPGVQSRLAAWKAGIKGFAERPVLGWGPENFVVVFGRFASGYGAFAQPHDQAHGKLVEVAATTGVAGLAAYLALWTLTFLVVWRAARGMETGERALTLFVGAALAGDLVQSQFLFDTAVNSLQTIMLLGFVVSLEVAAFPESRRPHLPAWLSGKCAKLFRRKSIRVALGGAVIVAAMVALTVHQGIYAAADTKHLKPRSWDTMAGGIEGFRPLANTYRQLLFGTLGHSWPRIRAEDGPRALRLLEWASREAKEAVSTEPVNWRIHQSLARLFRAAAATDPQYGDAARRYLERARAGAPNRAVFPRTLRPPDSLAARRLDDGRYELHWRWPEDAGYVTVKETRGQGHGRHILHVYDPGRTSFVLPEGRAPGVRRYSIKACRFPGQCSASVEWAPVPGIVVPTGEVDARP